MIAASAPIALDEARTRAKFRWRRKSLADMSRSELEDALLELNGLYLGALEHIGKTKAVQLVPLEVTDRAPSAIVAMLSAVTLMSILIGVVAVVL